MIATDTSDPSWSDLRPILDEELSRLPRKSIGSAHPLLPWKAGRMSRLVGCSLAGRLHVQKGWARARAYSAPD